MLPGKKHISPPSSSICLRFNWVINISCVTINIHLFLRSGYAATMEDGCDARVPLGNSFNCHFGHTSEHVLPLTAEVRPRDLSLLGVRVSGPCVRMCGCI